jgi:hypothetical protein
MQTVVALGKMTRHFTRVVKTSHGLFPKAFLHESLSTTPAGSNVHLNTTMEGDQLVATRYKYNRRKDLFFISNVGAGGMADGTPYIQRWADDNGNIVTRPYLSTPCSLQLLRAQSSGRQPQPVTTT